jgi:hypothetical protein
MVRSAEQIGEHPYQHQWQAYSARKWRLFVLLCVEFVAFIPFIVFSEKALKYVFPTGDLAFVTANLVFGTVYIVTATRLRNFPCPRCGKNFFGGFFATPETMLGRSCANCGLRKYEGS